jgi:hypothetical protein
MRQPLERRQTLNAGHTPSHSISGIETSGPATPVAHNFDEQAAEVGGADSGGVPPFNDELGVSFDGQFDEVTPTKPGKPTVLDKIDVKIVDPVTGEESGDVELKGPLGLSNSPGDDIFLAKLTEKLEKVAEEKDEDTTTTTESEFGDYTDGFDGEGGHGAGQMSDAEVLRTALKALGRKGLRGDVDVDGKEDDVAAELKGVPSTDDIPILRLKRSVNFGRPLGSL